MKTPLQLRLLGTPEVIVGEVSLTETLLSKAQAILYYLAMTGEPQSRTSLATLFWGDMPEATARANLRKAVANLRATLDPYLDLDRHTMAFKSEADLWIDAVELQAKLGGDPSKAGPEQLQAAVELYRGDFLAGFYVRNAPDFETWMNVEQTRLRELVVQALHLLAAAQAQQGNLSQGITTLRRLLGLEPWREEAHQRLMLLLAQDGQRSAALAQYEICCQVLDDELGVEPSRETVELYEEIRAGKSERSREPAWELGLLKPGQNRVYEERKRTKTDLATTSSAAPLYNLPAQSTPFVGRQQEITDIVRRLQDPACRLLTLIGPGGIGKTRLAIQAAQTIFERQPARDHFSSGILFVPLTPVSTPGGIVAAIADAANFQFYRDVAPDQQLLDYLREKQILLILDNFEHLAEGAGLLSQILATAPKVKLLVTSRTALNLQEAWFHPVTGLAFPSSLTPSLLETGGGEPAGGIQNHDALHLFEQCARRTQVNFSLAAELPSVLRICQLVEGMPLGIELAAAWMKVLPADKIAGEIERSLDILTTRYQNIPERHRSMRVIMEQSWQLLTAEEQRVFRRLSLFRGGFQQEAAQMIAGASLMMLAIFVEKSLLRVTETGRYQIHELLRQFAAEQLAADLQEEAVTRERHSAFYLRFLKARELQLSGGEQLTALNQIGEEIDNIRFGWQWAVEQGHLATIDQALVSLYNFYQIRSRYQEGQEILAQAITQLQKVEALAEIPEFQTILHRLFARRGAFYYFQGDYEAAQHDLELSLPVLNLTSERAFIRLMLGEVAIVRGNRAQGEVLLRDSLALYQEIGDKNGRANALHKLAVLRSSFGDYTEGKHLAEECLRLSRQLGRADWAGYALDVLGWTTTCLGEYPASEAYYRESLAVFQKIGDQLGIALALGGIGGVAWALGGERLVEAKQYLEQSLAICRNIGHRYQAASRLWYLAQINHDAGMYAEAQAYGEAGLAMAEEVDSPIFASYNLCVLGGVARDRGDFPIARQQLIQALEIAAEDWQLPPLTIALYNFALLLIRQSEPGDPSALSHFERKKLQALEQLYLIAEQPACWYAFKQRAARLQARLEAELPPELVHQAKQRARQTTLEAAVMAIVQGEV